jgi:hypothetical protein
MLLASAFTALASGLPVPPDRPADDDPRVTAALAEILLAETGCADADLRVAVDGTALLVLAPADTRLPDLSEPASVCASYLSKMAPVKA